MKIVDALERLRAPLNPMVALARRIGWGLAIVVGLLIVTTILTARTGDPALWPPAAGSPTVEILVSATAIIPAWRCRVRWSPTWRNDTVAAR